MNIHLDPIVRSARRMLLGALVLAAVVALALGRPAPASAAEPSLYKFDFGPGAVGAGYLPILPTTIYDRALGYGFEPGGTLTGVDRGGSDPVRGDSSPATGRSSSRRGCRRKATTG